MLKFLSATSTAGTEIFETVPEESDGLSNRESVLPVGIPNFIEWRSEPGTVLQTKQFT